MRFNFYYKKNKIKDIEDNNYKTSFPARLCAGDVVRVYVSLDNGNEWIIDYKVVWVYEVTELYGKVWCKVKLVKCI